MSPQKLGRYQVIEELGKGAMGLVYLAEDPIIGRQLALKTFRVGLSAKDAELEQFRARFLREAQSAGRLTHPNIVTIHDVVEEGGEFVIAMEYIKGTDLKHLMQRQDRLDLRFVVDIVAQISEGLDYAHSRGVVHRDIKPANIIITAEKVAKITDFGIARVDQSNLTVEGQLLGTPNYMAPEQIQGKEVDHRADLFSLGVMLYEMVTGKKPFAGENLTVVTHRIVYESFVSPDRLVPGLPPRLLQVLDKSLQKDPEKRYGRGADMARDLRAVFGGDSSPRVDNSIASFLDDVDSALADPAFGGTVATFGGASGPSTYAGNSSSSPAFAGMTSSPAGMAPASSGYAGSATGATPPPGSFGGTLGPGTLGSGTLGSGTLGSGTLGPGAAGYPGGTLGPGTAGGPPGSGSFSAGTGAYPPGTFPARNAGHYPPQPAPAPPAAKKNGLLIGVGALAAVLLLAALGFIFLRKSSAPAPTTTAAVIRAEQSEASRLIAEGRDLLAKGESGKAFEALERALVHESGNQEARRLLEQAQRQMLDTGAQRDDAQVRDQLTRAEAALQTRDYDKAYAIANQILTVDPQNERALRVRGEADDGRRRRDGEKSRVQDRLLKPVDSSAAADPPLPVSSRPETVAEANLKIELFSELPEGVVNVWVGSLKVWGETFDFGKAGGLFRRGKGSGSLTGGGAVPGGQVKIRVYVVGKVGGEQKTLSKELNTSLEGGSNHLLKIQVSEEGTLTVQLD